MIHTNKNFSRSNIENYTFENGDEFVNCNFSRSVPHTVILSGLSGLVFSKCNLVNCDIPADSEKIKCLHFHKSICSHLHENRLVAGEITECIDNCEHVVDTDEIIIDGVVLGINYHYEDVVI